MRLLLSLLPALLLAVLVPGCAGLPLPPPAPGCPAPASASAAAPATATCPACPTCPTAEPPKPAAKALQAAEWSELPGWAEDNVSLAYAAFATSCPTLLRNEKRRALWAGVCAADAQPAGRDAAALRAWFETQFRPWALTNADGTREGLITGYYEPIIRGRRIASADFRTPVFGPPEDMVVVELAELYPELRHLRLRGRIEGRKLVPYYSRSEWEQQEEQRSKKALLWTDDPIDYFFLQIQGSGQVMLEDGARIRLNYADQNGHPYKSIGRWLIDQGELQAHQASMQGIKAWAAANPKRLNELLNANPSLVFFRELPATGSGPPGALGIALTPERSMAIDPRHVPLGAPVYLATTRPNSNEPLQRLMLAQDTGGAIRGVVRGDFYWGSGLDAGAQAGKMRQPGRTWVLLPRAANPEELTL
ncbi:MAG: murein transglycosylase A [Rhodocyclaceae bacterium]|nr:murein transglycosylase A [Rhodocyclaceae bacterium]